MAIYMCDAENVEFKFSRLRRHPDPVGGVFDHLRGFLPITLEAIKLNTRNLVIFLKHLMPNKVKVTKFSKLRQESRDLTIFGECLW